MPLSAGDKLGPYEILAPLGAGGMGEVYRAKDTKLKRDVAIKVLPAALAHDPDRLARFEREARLLASLDHPNIGAIYGLEESNGTRALILALIEGPTLADRIELGAIPLDETIHIAQQMAEALEYAHDRGVIHRDLKPANVKITPEGTVKVLDFGLAKALTGEGDSSPGSPVNSPTMSPTLTMRATQAGMILGTAAYMAPEQAKGKTVDRRADIWAFGVVLFEMLTGQHLFTGDTAAEIIASAIKEEPRLDRLPASTPPVIRRLIERCLNKDPKQRLQAIGEARILLYGQMKEPSPTPVPIQLQSQRGRLPWMIAAGIAILLAAGLGLGLYRATRPPEPKPLVRLDVDFGSDVALGSVAGADTILSPDGTRMVYVSHGKLFTRRLDQPTAVELAGADGAFAPFFSPDGQWIAFFANDKLKKISVEGGAAITLCDANTPRGGAWGEDGNIIVSLTNTRGLYRVPSSGGAPAPLTELAQGEVTQRWPQILPGGKAILFTSGERTSRFDEANIEVMMLADHRRKTLQRGATFGRYLPGLNGTGHLAYVNKGTLFAVPFDPDKLETRGTPSPVLEGVSYNTTMGSAQFDVSKNGTLVYRGGEAAQDNLVTAQWLDAAGKTQSLLPKAGSYQRPRVSPDGERVAFDDGADIWVYETRRDTMTRLTFDGARNIAPVWSPDGRYILFGGTRGAWWVRSDAASKPQLLMQSKDPLYPFSFTPDGKRLAYSDVSVSTFYDIFVVTIESDGAGLHAGKPERFLQTPADERNPTFSPDGRWLAYPSNESGTYQVYVRAFPDKGGKWQISNAGGAYPVWSSNGQELFFRGNDNRIMVTTYAAKADSFVPGKPRVWSERQLMDFGIIGTANYDLAPDGKRILALMPVKTTETQKSQNHVTFLENFADELRRKVPVNAK